MMSTPSTVDWFGADAEAAALDGQLDELSELIDGENWRPLGPTAREAIEARYNDLRRRFLEVTDRLLSEPAADPVALLVKLRWWGRRHGGLDTRPVGAGRTDASRSWSLILDDCAAIR